MSLLPFTSKNQRRNFELVLSALANVGYTGDLVKKDYRFRDWFAAGKGKSPTSLPQRIIDAALFGRVPAAYETALIGVALANGEQGAELANANRALGAPLIIVIGENAIGIWGVGRELQATRRVAELTNQGFAPWAHDNRESLAPSEFLRTKNIGGTPKPLFYQASLFAGLIPELEERIAGLLEPRLIRAFDAGWKTYEASANAKPPERRLFQLAFWLLTGKVFADRGHSSFANLNRASGADEVLARVAKHYRREPQNILNRQTRDAVFDRIWSDMDFQNLSVEVLSQLWSSTLVTKETRKELGIHRTRRSLVRYIIDRIPFDKIPPNERYVFEPCSGSAGFLIAAMERMHDLLPMAGHSYFRTRLAGLEKDPFGIEISKLCLSLADYPNPNGWNISHGDVFHPDAMKAALAKARVVLCNPPFEKFSEGERKRYHAQRFHKPAELLRRVLGQLRSDAVLGFVFPRTFLDGQDYRELRPALVNRFRRLETALLPDKGWDFASEESVLLIATEPQSGGHSQVTQARVREGGWREFDLFHSVRSRNTDRKDASGARDTLAVPEMRELWEYLDGIGKLREIANGHKGIRWTLELKENWDKLIKSQPQAGYRHGVKPRQDHLYAFQTPALAYLSFRADHRAFKAFERPWDKPKVIINKTAKSRGMWRTAAFPDLSGLVCGETFFPLWPHDPSLVHVLCSVLNGPVANAYLASHCGKREFTLRAIGDIPFPRFSESQKTEIARLVVDYVAAVESAQAVAIGSSFKKAKDLLLLMDAAVLDAYGLPPRLERQLLDFFNGSKRQVPFEFGDYFPADFEPYFRLSEWLTGRPARATVERFRSQTRELPESILASLAATDDAIGEDE